MNAGQTNLPNPLEQLFAELIDGTLDAGRQELLAARVADDRALRDRYVDQILLHVMLHRDRIRMEPRGARELSGVLSGEPLIDKAAVSIIPHREAPVAIGGTVRVSRPWPLSFATAAFAVATLVTILAMIAAPGWHTPRDGGEVLPSKPTAFAARVSGVKNAVWDGERSWSAGAGLLVGDEIALLNGAVTLTFDSGTRVAIEGPVRFRVENKNGGKLRQGSLIARVPAQAVGFTVETPAARVVDLGTEFGVWVDEAGKCEIHLFSGSADVVLTSNDGKPVSEETTGGALGDAQGQTHRLAAGDAMRIAPARDAEHIASSRERFRSLMAQLPRSPQERAEEYRSVILAAEPILYLPMDRMVEGRLLDLAPGERHGVHYAGEWQRKAIVPGRVGNALQLHGPQVGDYVMIPNPPVSKTGQLSVVAWVYAEEHTVHGKIVSLWGERGSEPGDLLGQFELALLQQTGVLCAGIAHADRTTTMLTANEGPLPLRSWQHVAVTADGKTLRLYRNGVEVGQTPCAKVFAEPDDKAMGVGVKPEGSDAERVAGNPASNFWHWQGRIDELAIFDRALPAEFIERLAHFTGAKEK